MSHFCRGENLRLERPLSAEPFRLAFPEGKLTVLVGRNGSGKTTLLRAMLGERLLAQGEIFLNGIPGRVADAKPRELAGVVALVPQEHRFPPELRLVDLLRFAFLPQVGMLGKLPSEDSPEIQEILESFHLSPLAHRPLKAISTGERQKAFLARALLQRPKILLLDEPTNHLDPGAIYAFWEALRGRREKISFELVAATHDLAFVKRYAEWVCALDAGQLRFQGPPQAFFDQDVPRQIFGGIL